MTAGPKTAAPSDAGWEAAIRDRLADVVPRLVPGAPSVAAVTELAADVWRVDLADGGCLVAKHQLFGLLTRGEPYDLLAVEVDVLRRLRAAGCPVPVAFGADPEAQLVLLEYAGPRTVADALRGAPAPTPGQRDRWRRQVLRGLHRIEAVLADDLGHWQGRTAPGASADDLARTWTAVGRQARSGLSALVEQLAPAAGVRPVLEALVSQLAQTLGRRPPTLGPTDYHMGNLALDAWGERVTFLELAKLGWDWTERRAVQYTTSPDGDGRHGLLRQLEAVDLAGPLDAAAFAGHYVLFHLVLAHRLWASRRHDRVMRLFSTFARLLAAPTGGDPLTGELRRQLQRLASSPDPDR